MNLAALIRARISPDDARLAQAGERRAARWLRRRGFSILDRNMRRGRDEADILACDPDGRTLVVVEVKTRRDDARAPEDAIDARKRDCLERIAWDVQRRHPDRPVRIDVIAIVWPRSGRAALRHHRGC